MKDEGKSNHVDKGMRNDEKAPKNDVKSEYEHSREANIARNNKLLRQVEKRGIRWSRSRKGTRRRETEKRGKRRRKKRFIENPDEALREYKESGKEQ